MSGSDRVGVENLKRKLWEKTCRLIGHERGEFSVYIS